MYKRGALVILSILLFTSVLAQSNNASNNSSTVASTGNDIIDKAYQCLRNQINAKTQNDLSLQEAIFSILALGSDAKLEGVINTKAISNNHWGEGATQIKETAQVLLAYKRLGKNTDAIASWLTANERIATDLAWYLQIDTNTHSSASCTVKYGNEQRAVTINADQTLTGNPGSCLSISQNGYWLRVTNNNNCINATYETSCDQEFTTALLYQRSGSSTVYVTSGANSAPPAGRTYEHINSKCFSTSSSGCDYEGTLWAAFALDAAEKNIDAYIPYLFAFAESNLRFMPQAILYKLAQGPDQYSTLVQAQQQNKFWQAPNSPYNRYYDSALAMLALIGSNAQELTNAQEYFKTIVTPEGCWNNNNLRDTGFLLYAGWPRGVVTGSGGNGQPASEDCNEKGYYCTSSVFVCNDLQGVLYNAYDCASGVCCSKQPVEETCADQNGIICTAEQTCSGSTVSSSQGSCCIGTCELPPAVSECETNGGTCYTSCNADEEQLGYACPASSDICCKQKDATSDEGGFWNIWTILLMLLIVLVVLAIIFRHQLQLWLYRMKSGRSSNQNAGVRPGPPPAGRPPFPPARGPLGMQARAPARMIPPTSASPQVRRVGISKSDSDMEETMKKLRDMSK
jgi:hypothetical protein